MLSELGADRIINVLAVIERKEPAQALLPHLVMPAHHDVRSSDVFSRRLHSTLAAAAERGPVDFPELLLTPGVGLRTVRSLAMVAEVVHGAPYRFSDQSRRLERSAEGPSLDAFIAGERAASPAVDGHSVFGWEAELSAINGK